MMYVLYYFLIGFIGAGIVLTILYYLEKGVDKISISLNDILIILFFTIIWPISLIIVIVGAIKEYGDKTIITLNKKKEDVE